VERAGELVADMADHKHDAAEDQSEAGMSSRCRSSVEEGEVEVS
jgi:hypothetical protein